MTPPPIRVMMPIIKIKRHADHVNVEVGIFEPLLTGAVEATGDPVHADGDAELVGFAEKWRKVGIVEVSRADDARNHRANEAEIFDRAAQLLGGFSGILQRHRPRPV